MAKILIVDDSWLTRKSVEKILVSEGYDITQAENGVTGLEMIEEQVPDCVLCDLLMPELDGYGVLKALTEKGNEIPVIVLTADIQDTAKDECIKLGAVDFLNKPPQPDQLIEIVKKALSK